jgi:L-aspartate oxidase
MKKYDERGTLAPRDVVSRAIHEELLASGHPCVYLDITHKPDDWIVERFPHIAKTCSQYGIDITSQPIPVVPAAHYSCGGVLVDADGATNMERLWAVGEVSCTGIHGANRLASTSLLEGLVWGARCGEKVVELLESSDASKERIPEIDPWQMAPDDPDPALITQDWNTIRYTMWNYVGLVRTRKRLNRARNLLRELETEIEDFYAYSIATDGLIGLRNGITAARAITMAALENRQTCGCHYRVD